MNDKGIQFLAEVLLSVSDVTVEEVLAFAQVSNGSFPPRVQGGAKELVEKLSEVFPTREEKEALANNFRVQLAAMEDAFDDLGDLPDDPAFNDALGHIAWGALDGDDVLLQKERGSLEKSARVLQQWYAKLKGEDPSTYAPFSLSPPSKPTV